jgi:hypothetical protein
MKEQLMEGVHSVFDGLGLIPGAGEVFDGANAVIYASRGKTFEASLSLGAMIPFIGWSATGGKLARKVPYIYKANEALVKAVKAAKGRGSLIKAGNVLDKGGFTAAGRALQKHGSRTGSIFPKATGNAATINAQGEAVLNRILTNPNATNAIRHHARFGNVLEYRIPGGQGARFSGDGKTFIGFLE